MKLYGWAETRDEEGGAGHCSDSHIRHNRCEIMKCDNNDNNNDRNRNKPAAAAATTERPSDYNDVRPQQVNLID